MRYTEEMILRSSSGYCMPFEEPIKQDVQMSLGYGEQKNPVTGETFFHLNPAKRNVMVVKNEMRLLKQKRNVLQI